MGLGPKPFCQSLFADYILQPGVDSLKKVHLLNLGNPRKVKENLSGILEQPELKKIETEIVANTLGLYRLGRQFLSFAVRQSPPNWRQRILKSTTWQIPLLSQISSDNC